MANNFHSDLPNDQIHNPKDFSVCPNSSVLTKDNNGNLDWNTSPYGTSTTITCAGDVSGGLHNRNFYIFWDENNKLEMHFAVTGETASFVPTAGYDQATITIAANNTNLQVAAEIMAELGRQTSPYNFTSSVDGKGKVTFSGMTNAPDTIDGITGFKIENTKTYTGTTVLTSTSGVLSWQAGGGGGGSINSVVSGSASASTGNALRITTSSGAVTIEPKAYAGTTNVGHVPAGGSATTFLRGDGTWVTPTTGSTYSAGQGIDATNLASNLISVDGSVVRTTGAQTISGEKTFLDAVHVDKPSTSDSSTRAVTSQWVNDQNYGTGTVTSITAGSGLTGGTITGSGTIGLSTNIPTKSANNSYTGDNTFAGNTTFGGDVDVPTATAGDNSTKAASTAFVTAAVAAGGGGGGGGVSTVTATKPANSSGGANPVISVDRATSTTDGYLASSDFAVFNAKQNPISVTNIGTGQATLVGGNTINVPYHVPQYRYNYRGFINQSAAGIWAQNAPDSSKPFEHRISFTNSSTGLSAQKAIDGCNYVCRNGDKFNGVYGHICGTRNSTVKFYVCLFRINCGSGTQADNLEILGDQTITLADPHKSSCIDIPANSSISLTDDDIILFAIEKGSSGTTNANYSVTLKMTTL